MSIIQRLKWITDRDIKELMMALINADVLKYCSFSFLNFRSDLTHLSTRQINITSGIFQICKECLHPMTFESEEILLVK